MTPEQHRAATELFAAAMAVAPAARDPFLVAACGGDPELLAEVRAALRETDTAFLDGTALGSGFKIPAPVELLASPPPRSVGKYRLQRLIGVGGAGDVYAAVGDAAEPMRAIKILRPELCNGEAAHRFRQEWDLLAELRHEHIVQAIDSGTTEDGRLYIVMEWIDGLPIDVYCDEEQLPARERIALLLPVCKAIHYAHEKGLVHRDLKPDNILVAGARGSERVKIIDFGIAKIVGLTGPHPATTSARAAAGRTPQGPAGIRTEDGLVVGTRGFMSPEQALGRSGSIDRRTDIYQLGLLVRELAGDELDRDALLSRIAAQCLHTMPQDRYNTARDVGRGLEGWLTGRTRLVRQIRRTGLVAILAAAAVLGWSAASRWHESGQSQARSEGTEFPTGIVESIRQLELVAGTMTQRESMLHESLHDVDAKLASSPRDPKLICARATMLECLGDLRQSTGEITDALRLRTEVLAVRRKLAMDQPDDAEAQRHHALAMIKLGDSNILLRRFDTAGSLFLAAGEIHRALYDRTAWPKDLDELCWTEARMAGIAANTGQSDQYRLHIERRIELAEQQLLVRNDHVALRSAGDAYMHYAAECRERGETASWIANAKRSHEFICRAAETGPNVRFYQISLASSWLAFGEVLGVQNRIDALEEAEARAVEIADRLVRADPECQDSAAVYFNVRGRIAARRFGANDLESSYDLLRPVLDAADRMLSGPYHRDTNELALRGTAKLAAIAQHLGHETIARRAVNATVELRWRECQQPGAGVTPFVSAMDFALDPAGTPHRDLGAASRALAAARQRGFGDVPAVVACAERIREAGGDAAMMADRVISR